MPLLNFDSRTLARAPYEQLSQTQTASEDDDDSVLDVDEDQGSGPPKKRKRWWDYLPLCREHHPFDLQIISVNNGVLLPNTVMIFLILAPHYSILMMLISYFLQIRHSPLLFALNLSLIYTLTFLTFSSLIVCVVRDPGAVRVGAETNSEVTFGQTRTITIEEDDENDDTITDLRDALRMPVVTKAVEDDFNAPHKWCRKCWAPKPERSHHCSICKRCVLKMGVFHSICPLVQSFDRLSKIIIALGWPRNVS